MSYTEVEVFTEKKKKYVTFDLDEQISGVKDFLNGIKINGISITNSQEDVIYIDSNLVVRGGITMYADNTVDIPSIYAGLPIDGVTIKWKDNIVGGVLYAEIPEINPESPTNISIKIGSTTYIPNASGLITLPTFLQQSDLDKYVTRAGNEDVTGVHPFVNGLKVGSLLINQL